MSAVALDGLEDVGRERVRARDPPRLARRARRRPRRPQLGDEGRRAGALPQRVAGPRVHEHRAADGAVALAQARGERPAGLGEGQRVERPVAEEASTRLALVVRERRADLRASGPRGSASTTAIFASSPGGTTSSSVRTLATIVVERGHSSPRPRPRGRWRAPGRRRRRGSPSASRTCRSSASIFRPQ